MFIPSLSSFSVIDLVAPGSSVTSDQIEEVCLNKWRALGFKARLQVNPVRLSHSSGISSFVNKAIINEKFQFLKKALTASDSEAVWCIRGGYGSQKLMPYLMRMKKPHKPKIFIGYSDVTVIQLFLALKWQWPSVHFPVLIHVENNSSASLRRFKALLTGTQKKQSFSGLKLLNPEYMNQKNKSNKIHLGKKLRSEIHSSLIGGNLTLIQSSIGTPWMSSFKDTILFLEDIGEAPYRLDRALWQMLNAGIFKGIKALVLGDFNYNSKRFAREVNKVFQYFSNQVSFPVLTGVPCGHGSKKEALLFLTPCCIKVSSEGKACMDISSPFII